MAGLSNRELSVLELFRDHVREKNYSPTTREAGKLLGCSRSTVSGALRVLEAAGLVTRLPGNHGGRTVRLTDAGLARLGEKAA